MEYDTQLDSTSIKLSTSQHSRRQSRSSLVHTPKRHSARIEKPKSVHQSPRVTERRRTFTSTKQYASLEDHYRSMFGDHSPSKQEVEMEIEPLALITRPFSWHPSSSRFSFSYQNSQASASASSQELLATQDCSSFTAEHSSNDIANVYPSMVTSNNDAHYASTASISPPVLPEGRPSSQQEVVWAAYTGNILPVTSESPAYSTAVDESTSWLLPDYAQHATSLPQYHAAQQDFLPIQHPGCEQQDSTDEEENELERQDSNVLVGMGLYDPPGSSSFMFGEGRCLKLEEEWEPPELPEDDDDAEDEAEQESSSEEEEEAPEPPKAVEKPWTMQTSVVAPTSNLAGQSFFFDDDDTITSEWWYQQLKQPTAQDAGLGYGWLHNA